LRLQKNKEVKELNERFESMKEVQLQASMMQAKTEILERQLDDQKLLSKRVKELEAEVEKLRDEN